MTPVQIAALRLIASGSSMIGMWCGSRRRVLDRLRGEEYAAVAIDRLIVTPNGWHALAALPDSTAQERLVSAALKSVCIPTGDDLRQIMLAADHWATLYEHEGRPYEGGPEASEVRAALARAGFES
jgi:hypothetical protein